MQKPKDGRNYQTLPSALCPLPSAHGTPPRYHFYNHTQY